MKARSSKQDALIWEPDALQASYLSHLYTEAGFTAQTFDSYRRFQAALAKLGHRPLLAVLAFDKDESRSLRRCARLRATYPLATLVVIAHRQDQASFIAALQAGVDIYLIKPLGSEELIARSLAQLQRSREILGAWHLSRGPRAELFGPLSFAGETVRLAGKALKLSDKERKLLLCLSRHAHQVISREQIAQRLWEQPQREGSRRIDNLVVALRKKLPEPIRLESRYGEGYRLTWEDPAS